MDDICGPSMAVGGGRCYRYFEDNDKLSWNEAAETCANFGGQLAILSTEQDWERFVNSTEKKRTPGEMFVGLRLAPASLPYM